MEIYNQYMPDICDGCTQDKNTIGIYYNITCLADLAYDLISLNLPGLITSVCYNSIKYAAFFYQWSISLSIEVWFKVSRCFEKDLGELSSTDQDINEINNKIVLSW